MADIGIFLSSEEHSPTALVRQAQEAEESGFSSVAISDHYHPWVDAQGESSFLWSVIGGISQTTRLKVTSAVTCPLVRIHPAVIAQAAATAQLMLEGRFVLGVGTGENLNEHILGHRWPPVATRREMLEEAVEIMRGLWQGGLYSHHGRYYEVENARIYSLPDEPPPVVVSAFGELSLELASSIGDGLVTTTPEASVVERYRKAGGKGPVIGLVKVCYGEDEAECRALAHRLWASEQLPGQLDQELALPSHLEAACELVSEEMVASTVSCGPDPEPHASVIASYLDAGFDEVYVNQIGPAQREFFEFYAKELRGRLAA